MIPVWLTAPKPPLFRWDGKPDPFLKIGAHVAWACWSGVALSHREWVAMRLGCPPACDPPVRVPEADPMRQSESWAAWRRFWQGCRTYRPINHSPETLPSRNGWNPLACQTDTEPMPLVTVERPIGNPYA
jgi:hypothetical protein